VPGLILDLEGGFELRRSKEAKDDRDLTIGWTTTDGIPQRGILKNVLRLIACEYLFRRLLIADLNSPQLAGPKIVYCDDQEQCLNKVTPIGETPLVVKKSGRS
jgi:hypothetical protein